MNWIEFAKKIELSETLIQQIQSVNLSEESYQTEYALYKEDHEAFYHSVLKKENAPMYFLAMYCRMACETYENYQKAGISEEIFFATFLDIRFWSDNYYNEYGAYGLGEYHWFWRHMDMTIFRLGRLQFEQVEMERDMESEEVVLRKGTEVISVHIPQGEALTIEDCRQSIEMARRKFGSNIPYICHSWLLFPGLKEVLDEQSNILKFQKLFQIVRIDYEEREAEWRIYGRVNRNLKAYPESTSLQRRAKEYLLQGKVLGSGFGIMK